MARKSRRGVHIFSRRPCLFLVQNSARFRIFGSSEILILGIFIIMKIPTKL